MKNFYRRLKRVTKNMPFHILLLRVVRRLSGKFLDSYNYKKALKKGTFLSDLNFFKKLGLKTDKLTGEDKLKEKLLDIPFLSSIFNTADKDFISGALSNPNKSIIIESSNLICSHIFELLGSGKIKVSYDMIAAGIENFKYNTITGDSEKKAVCTNIKNKISDIFQDSEIIDKVSNYNYEPINWHIDFKSGYIWGKDTWYKKIKYGDLPGADVKIPWELSRFQHLLLLGQAFVLTNDEKYVLEYIYEVTDWIENNPPEFGVNWKCTMDIAIRAANLIISLAFFKNSKYLTDKFLLYFIKNIYIHGEHITRNLEFGSITSNHYLSDIAGLAFVAEFFGDFRIGKKWGKFAANELKKEMKKQVYEDGVDFEASACYHRLVLELFFYTAVFITKNRFQQSDDLAQKCSDIFGMEFTEKLCKMFGFIAHSLKPDGDIPQFGDNDSGRFFIFCSRRVLDMRYLLSLAAVFFNESKFKIKEFEQDEEIPWVFGKNGQVKYKELNSVSYEEISSKEFENCGWCVMRNNSSYLFFGSGPNGQNDNGGHAHNDKLSFELYAGNTSIFIDPGTYLYTPFPVWRNTFRSTRYHNTITVDDFEQNEFSGNNLFRLENDSGAKIKIWKSNDAFDFIEAEHVGYKRLDFPVIHKRQIIFDKRENIWVISDILEGKGKHKFTINFNLHPGITPIIENNTTNIILNKGNLPVFYIQPMIDNEINLVVDKSWISEEYGIKEENFSVKYIIETNIPSEFNFILSLKKLQSPVKYLDNIKTEIQ